MKTMFVAPENTKKRFQKPNILRKRPKPPPKPSISEAHETPLSVMNLVTTSTMQDSKLHDKITLFKQCPSKSKQPVQRLIIENNDEESSLEGLYQIDGNVETDSSLAVTCDVLTNNNQHSFENTINVESFLNNSEMEQLVLQADVENDLSNKTRQGWCLDFIDDTQEIIIEDIDGSHLGSLRLASAPSPAHPAPSTPAPSAATTTEETHTSIVPTQNITLEYMNCTMNFKCDMQNCTKRFRSEEALNKHKNTHTKPAKPTNKDKPVMIECPVKKVSSSGVEEPCTVVCSNKKDIFQHFNDCHDPEDAMYVCEECGRRFYWAAGLRAHSRYHARRAAGEEPWVCTWPECGRAFRQPCRLREHMRAHTGDKPYPCRYPNCGWSFRTASKLVRHARRHTGERRHPCGECGRAFRRREHLRDHVVRHRANRLHNKCRLACDHTGCEKEFANLEALKVHSEKMHNGVLMTSTVEETTAIHNACISEQTDARQVDTKTQPQQTFMVTLTDVESMAAVKMKSEAVGQHTLQNTEPVVELAIPEPETEMPLQQDVIMEIPEEETELGQEGFSVAEREVVGSPRAARTHCTWPFDVPAPIIAFEENANQEYVLEEEGQVEMCEGSESNIYTIKSDLFLHGNVHNEDSEQMCSAVNAGVATSDESAGADAGEGAGAEHGEGEGGTLSLLDAHPTIDLMQEELMYSDAAVDESSFRVFLLSGDGEDLS